MLASQDLFARLSEITSRGVGSGADAQRLVPRKRQGGSQKLTETYALAENAEVSHVVISPVDQSPVGALLNSILAPRARGDKSDACVPIYPSAVAFQTLHGIVNKQNPANLAFAVESIGLMGGSGARGAVAKAFLDVYRAKAAVRENATAFLDEIVDAVAAATWKEMWARSGASGPEWPTEISGVTLQPSDLPTSRLASTPFRWFWNKWSRLCDPNRGWFEALPTRRFVDWAMCLLRTGLSFSYLWESEFYCRYMN